jgi:hypothetical protein
MGVLKTTWRRSLHVKDRELLLAVKNDDLKALAEAPLALGAKVIPTPPCILHQRFSVQNIQGGVIMTFTPAAKAPLEPADDDFAQSLIDEDGRTLLQVRRAYL